MKDLISLYREAVRDDWDKQTDATLANMQEAEQNLLSRLSAGEEAVKKIAELEKEISKVVFYACYKREMEAAMVKIAELEKELFDIKSKTFCAYCGFEIAIDNDAPLKIEAHIFECKKHPVCILSKRIAELEKEVERLEGK